MRVLVIFAHPVETSYQAALHAAVIDTLRAGGHEVDDLDLYAEGFQPVLSRAERLDYFDLGANTRNVARYVERLRAADGVVFCFPTWTFGEPAILKGFMDRVMVPGVSFRKDAEQRYAPNLTNIRRLAAVVTYGRAWWEVRLAIGDLPRRHITRYFRWFCARGCRTRYLAHYHMNKSTPETRARFLARVRKDIAAHFA